MKGCLTTKALVASVILLSSQAAARTLEYDLVIDYAKVNITGKEVRAMTINGGIPGPTLEMTEGDFVKVRVHNRMDVDTSVHWHGILLPNREDGVPYLTTPPIRPGTTHLFRFPVKQSGTYWYHSHTGLQEQRGVYGSIVIHPKKETVHADRDYVLVLSDWTDEDPHEVMRTLKRGSEYYSLKKGSIQTVTGAWRIGALKEMFSRSLMRMPPMDVSDVAYDSFLINGEPHQKLEAMPGEMVRLRLINASASSYFYLHYAGGSMKIISSDGLPVRPVETERLLIAVAETYDLLVKVPEEGKAFEFRATAQDGSGMTSVFIGEGSPVPAGEIPKPNLYRMHGDMGHEGMQMDEMMMDDISMADITLEKMEVHGQEQMTDMADHEMDMRHPSGDQAHTGHDTIGHEMGDMESRMEKRPLAPYKKLHSLKSTTLDPAKPLRKITLTLTGDMERYVWSFDGKVLSEADRILIRKGENVRILFDNKTMMHHPLHLHGHFFRVLNGQGEFAPFKHTVDIAPLAKQAIEFYANEEKDWFLHCHILYHMDAGMARIVRYEGSEIDPALQEFRKLKTNILKRDPWFFWGEAGVLSQLTDGFIMAANTRNSLSLDWEGGWKDDEYDADALYSRYYDRFLSFFGGLNVTDEETRGVIGLYYLLPLLIDSKFRIDSDGEGRLVLAKDLRITSRLTMFGDFEYDTETHSEWLAGAAWTVNRRWSLMFQYHSEFKGGAGVRLNF
ncbi:MAG: multicopper oxidase domain-containing protein [bacterium]|nr:multicopper oxidase domain-containing protein [bacterium]